MAIDTETMQLIERIVARSIANATSLKGAADEIAKGVTQYVGARYVPLFAEPLEWDKTKAYEPLTIVLHQGNSYTSRQYVPVGVEIDNDSFWALTGNYNAQVEQYRQEVKSFDGRITANANAIETEKTNRAAAVTAEMQRAQSAERELQTNIDAEKTRAQGAEHTLQANIDAEKTRAQGAEHTLQTNIDAEKTRAQGAEHTLQTNIDGIKNGGNLQNTFFPIEFSLGNQRAKNIITTLMENGFTKFSLIIDLPHDDANNYTWNLTDEFIDAILSTECTWVNFTFHGQFGLSTVGNYCNAARSFLNKYGDRFNIKKVYIMNEVNDFIFYHDDIAAQYIQTFKDYKVGICFNARNYFLAANAPQTLAAIDYIGLNLYPRITTYGKKVSDREIYSAIINQLNLLENISTKTDAIVEVTEFGCKPYYECYSDTSDWTISGIKDISAVSRLLSVAFNENIFRNMDGVGIWYISWFAEFPEMFNFFKNWVINNE